MKKLMKVVGIGLAIVAGLFVLVGVIAVNSPGSTKPEGQRELEQLRRQAWDAYKAAPNEIEASRIWRDANQAVRDHAQQRGRSIQGWVAEVHSLTTNQGGSSADVRLASGPVRYVQIESVPRGTARDDQLAKVREGDAVLFDGELVEVKGEIVELSLTERGSLERPEFRVRITGIRPAP